ncbi:LLM class flavin-dependent oxidoreductase, partial [Shewanella algae]|uniref:LLM class flavin-dependent oxidoreductase n=1 Tax=Shewanella algae TaxID=38313 RepID=UPI00313C4690
TPLLFQAGTSTSGRSFAGRNAEITFLASLTPETASADIARINAEAVKAGRRAGDVKFLTQIQPIIGSTEAEAQARYRQFLDWRNDDAYLAHAS